MNDKFSFQPTLVGEAFCIRPLLQSDFDELYQCASDKEVWAGHPSKDRYQKPVFERWFEQAMASNATIVMIDKSNNEIIGTSRYYFYGNDQDISIGYTFIVRKHWGGQTNYQIKQLMMTYAFKFFNTVWFHIAPSNIRSQRAVEKIGAVYSHQALSNITGKDEPWLFYRVDKE